MKKLTILGDIVCDNEMLKRAKISDGEYNFDSMFFSLIDYLKDSSYVIANLESVIGDNKYTKSSFSFCNPEQLIICLKKIGVTAVSLANNHILDRGEDGIEKTIYYLKKNDIDYFGINEKDLKLKLEGVNIGILGYTDSTNYHINKNNINELKKYKINILKKIQVSKTNHNIFYKIYHKLNPDFRLKIKRILGGNIRPITDNNFICDDLMLNIERSVKRLKNNNYYVIMYPHMGGQFNVELGKYSKSIIDKFLDMNIDSIVITHPHIIQKKYKSNIFSIGDVIISPNSKFVVWDSLPQYSLVVNYYFDKKKIIKITVSFLICVKDINSYLKVYPFYDYYYKLDDFLKKKYEEEFKNVYMRLFEGKVEIKDEYTVWEV